jgi:hypothetical protein
MNRDSTTFHKCAGFAHLWRAPTRNNPFLCKTESTFPLMTSGASCGILESIQGRAIPSVWSGKGRAHERTFQHAVAKESGRRKALCHLRRTSPGRARGRAGLVTTISAAGKYDRRDKHLSGLQPAPTGPAHRRRHQCSRIGTLSAISTLCRLLSKPAIKNNCQGQRQASSLPSPWPLV